MIAWGQAHGDRRNTSMGTGTLGWEGMGAWGQEHGDVSMGVGSWGREHGDYSMGKRAWGMEHGDGSVETGVIIFVVVCFHTIFLRIHRSMEAGARGRVHGLGAWGREQL